MGDRSNAEETHQWSEEISEHQGFDVLLHSTQPDGHRFFGFCRRRSILKCMLMEYHLGDGPRAYFLITDSQGGKYAVRCGSRGNPLQGSKVIFLGSNHQEVEDSLLHILDNNPPAPNSLPRELAYYMDHPELFVGHNLGGDASSLLREMTIV